MPRSSHSGFRETTNPGRGKCLACEDEFYHDSVNDIQRYNVHWDEDHLHKVYLANDGHMFRTLPEMRQYVNTHGGVKAGKRELISIDHLPSKGGEACKRFRKPDFENMLEDARKNGTADPVTYPQAGVAISTPHYVGQPGGFVNNHNGYINLGGVATQYQQYQHQHQQPQHQQPQHQEPQQGQQCQQHHAQLLHAQQNNAHRSQQHSQQQFPQAAGGSKHLGLGPHANLPHRMHSQHPQHPHADPSMFQTAASKRLDEIWSEWPKASVPNQANQADQADQRSRKRRIESETSSKDVTPKATTHYPGVNSEHHDTSEWHKCQDCDERFDPTVERWSYTYRNHWDGKHYNKINSSGTIPQPPIWFPLHQMDRL